MLSIAWLQKPFNLQFFFPWALVIFFINLVLHSVSPKKKMKTRCVRKQNKQIIYIKKAGNFFNANHPKKREKKSFHYFKKL